MHDCFINFFIIIPLFLFQVHPFLIDKSENDNEEQNYEAAKCNAVVSNEAVDFDGCNVT